jgi:3,4-dihydroxy 2-butanone 4-phosphate synthase/GTP cyclohydrolase II
LRAYHQTTNDQVHLALTKGTWKIDEPILVRMNSTLVNSDILGTLTNNDDQKLDSMFKQLNAEGKGAIVFINQDIHGFNLISRLKALKVNQSGDDIAKAPRVDMDEKDFGIGAQILHDLGVHKIKLMSNTKRKKRVGMIGYGLEIIDYVNY